MRIEFITQDDPSYILPLFEEFFRSYGKEFAITQVSCCPTMGSRPRGKLLRELLMLYGAAGMARLVTRVARAKLLGRLPRNSGAGRFYSLPQLCQAYQVPCVPIGNPNDPEFVEGLRARKPDVIVSVACPYLFRSPLLSLPPLGCINIHHAPLPRYKGMMPTFWQLFHGEKTVGLTIHYMVDKLDDGPMLLQEGLPVEPGEPLDHLIRRAKRHGAHALGRVLRRVREGSASTFTASTQGSYFTFPTLEEIREFHRRGLRAI